MHPFVVELLRIACRERPIVTLALPSRLREPGTEHEERCEKENQRPHADGDNGDLEIEERGVVQKNASGDPGGDEGTVRECQRGKRRRRRAEEAEPAEVVGVGGDQAQLDA